MTLTLMPNIRKDKGIGSDSSRCSVALADQTSGSNVTLEPKHQTSSDVGLSPVKETRKRRRSGRKHKASKEVMNSATKKVDSDNKSDNKAKRVCFECNQELTLQTVYQTTVYSKAKKKGYPFITCT